MALPIIAKTLAAWFAILVLAFVNGALREALLIPQLGRTAGLIISGCLLSCFILGVAYVALPWLGVREKSRLLRIGVAWLALTLLFEFAFGFIQGKNLAEMLEAYTFKDGNIWPLVLLVTVLSPWLAGKLRGWP